MDRDHYIATSRLVKAAMHSEGVFFLWHNVLTAQLSKRHTILTSGYSSRGAETVNLETSPSGASIFPEGLPGQEVGEIKHLL